MSLTSLQLNWNFWERWNSTQSVVHFIIAEEFAAYAQEEPELVRLFMDYQKSAELRDEALNNSLLNTMTRSKAE